ncbi:hypothetical protein [Nocardia cyriacigeorgica]|uniref:hypothetical protein n=1 Tax=Nocardia cyriacigeorgica TaxID=135487 RepID=UPI0024582A58|nr:hypothetical protein [Nocardia cyriacigeorgica]
MRSSIVPIALLFGLFALFSAPQFVIGTLFFAAAVFVGVRWLTGSTRRRRVMR